MGEELKPLLHHKKVGPCLTRPPYRDGKRKKAVKVFTIADESMYLLIFGVPSLDLSKPLTEKIQQISPLQHIRQVKYPNSEAFTDTYLVKLDSVSSARNIKKRLDDSSFYGGVLHIVYAPEYESVAECRIKIHSYRKINDAVARKAAAEKQREMREYQLHSEKILQTPHLQLSTPSLNLPPALVTKSGNDDTTIFSNPYSISLPVSTSLQLNEPQNGDAVDDAQHFWASRGFHVPPVISTSKSASSTQAIPPSLNISRYFLPPSSKQPLTTTLFSTIVSVQFVPPIRNPIL
ncbi:hypothetical protein Aperf_G00000030515 [Anoplocephala perfoliata]